MEAKIVFGCGVDCQVFKAKYDSLDEENKARLERVARRMWLTLKLRYETSFYYSPFAWHGERRDLEMVELPSMEVYLLCTCLDTLAGQAGHVDFRHWIKEQPDVHDLGPREIADLYTRYLREHGVGRNLRRLFTNLPPAAKEWLSHNVVIRRFGEPLSVGAQDVGELPIRLYYYFYNVWRNKFTHGSVSRLTTRSEDVREPQLGGWWVTPASGTQVVLRSERPNQKWNVSYREGLDEGTILRLIIHVAGLQLLGIEPTAEVISANLWNYSRLSGLYALVREVHQNAGAVCQWADSVERELSKFTELELLLLHRGIPPLSTAYSKVILDRYEDNPLESGLRKITVEYIELADQINSAISEFNSSHLPPGDRRNADVRWQAIKQFLQELLRLESCNSVRKWPSRKEMTGVWRAIRNPCYSPQSIRAKS